MKRIIHLDIETFSSVDLKTCGVYRYTSSPDFQIMLLAYAFDNGPVKVVEWDELTVPSEVMEAFHDPETIKYAHNAAFERLCFRAIGIDIPVEQWRCTAVKAAYCGLPMALGQLSIALKLGEKGKLSTGQSLIRYFCMPAKPTKANGGRTRNLPHHNPQKWAEFKTYVKYDVISEMEVHSLLKPFTMPSSEWRAYQLDQHINDRGIRIDTGMAGKAIEIDTINTEQLRNRAKALTGLDNPNSPSQLRDWICSRLQKEIKSLAQEAVKNLLDQTEDRTAREVLTIRQKTSRTSIKKYAAMLACAGKDNRARGLFQFYGAGRTGRWAGRLIQLQNLPRNYMDDLAQARSFVAAGDYDSLEMLYDISDTLSQLIRTALVPSEGRVFAVADFSAIEARVIAWLAGENWRLEVFRTHGKIYEASASKMFNVPIEQIGKGSDLRSKGKVAELALGYQGGVEALRKMGGEKMGLSDEDMEIIVAKWRAANKNITALWSDFQKLALEAIRGKCVRKHAGTGIVFKVADGALKIQLPSGRELIYWNAQVCSNRFGREGIRYRRIDQTIRQWVWIDTYGGKLTENIVQAIARDLLLHSMFKLEKYGVPIVAHIHDEVVCEIDTWEQASSLEQIIDLMSVSPEWAADLPLGADGYTCEFYKKD
jgi:DNA polymerase bacteriophage-type